MSEKATSDENKSNSAEEQYSGSILVDPAVRPSYYKKNGLECYEVQRASMGLVKHRGNRQGDATSCIRRVS